MPVTDDLRTIAPVQEYRERSHPDALFRASMLGYCPRKQLLAAKGINLRLTDNLSRKYAMHGGSHDRVQEWIEKTLGDKYGQVLTEHKIFDPETRCGGHIDAVVVDANTAHVIEIKTYAFLPKGYDFDNAYWVNQISFYYHAVMDLEDWPLVQPIVLIVTLDGYVRVVEPNITDEHKGILSLLNMQWDLDLLPSYTDCHNKDCAKCPLQSVCTEPIESIAEFAEEVQRRAIQE